VGRGDQLYTATFRLDQNYPKPFRPSTTIKYELPGSSEVRLSVYDNLGREVSSLVNERRDAGIHEVEFDGSNLASGVYFYRLQAGQLVQTRKPVLLR
jgi:glucuronoarabinoxylan endo-1,4-beta-xylanase